jgi:hypothetical protein
MKKIQLLGLALVAMLAFSAFAAMTASAETTLLAEWLIDGVGLTELVSVTTSGSILLINKAGLGGTPIVKCEGSFDGTVGPNGEDEITEVLSIGGVTIGNGAALTGTPLQCVTTNSTIGCGSAGSKAEVWVDNLPWHTNLELMEDGSFLDHLFGGGAGLEPGYDIHCVATATDNLCEGLATSLMTNTLEGDVKGEFIENSETATCTIGTGTLLTEAGKPGLETTLDGLTLAVSSE